MKHCSSASPTCADPTYQQIESHFSIVLYIFTFWGIRQVRNIARDNQLCNLSYFINCEMNKMKFWSLGGAISCKFGHRSGWRNLHQLQLWKREWLKILKVCNQPMPMQLQQGTGAGDAIGSKPIIDIMGIWGGRQSMDVCLHQQCLQSPSCKVYMEKSPKKKKNFCSHNLQH